MRWTGMPDYSQASIYWIRALADDQPACYVGSTTDFRRRGHQHKSVCNKAEAKNYNLPLYVFIRDHGGWSEWEYVELERFPCSGRAELCAREQVWIDRIKPSLNHNHAKSSGPKEYARLYYQRNKDQIRARNKAWAAAHRDKMRGYCRDHYQRSKRAQTC